MTSSPRSPAAAPAPARLARPDTDATPPTSTPGPIAQLREGRLRRRLPQLVAGLLLYGFSMAMLVDSGLGLDPWDVLHEGLAERVPLTFGQVTIAVGIVVLLAWIPLRQQPGLGTVLNVVLVGLAADAGIAVLPTPDAIAGRVALLVGGIVLNGLAGALYVTAHLGTGPRDGLWVGVARRTGRSPRLVRTVIELSALAAGFALGGTVGVGTVLYAVAIGPLVQWFMPWVDVRRTAAGRAVTPDGGPGTRRPARVRRGRTRVPRGG